MAEDAEEIPGRPVFSVGARVRVLAATAPGILPRLATGCGEAIVTAFDPRTREYTVKALALYSRPQTKIPEVAVVAPSRDGNEEMYSRGGARSSGGARAASEANRRVAELEKQVEQLRARTERAERAWRRRGRHGRGRRGDPRAARGIENSRRVAQQRGSKRGSPGREINTDQAAYEITAFILSSEFIFMAIYPHSTISKSSPVDRDLSRSRNSNFKMK